MVITKLGEDREAHLFRARDKKYREGVGGVLELGSLGLGVFLEFQLEGF